MTVEELRLEQQKRQKRILVDKSSNPLCESEVEEMVKRVSGGGAACGSAEESVIISSISDKGSVINTDLVSGSLLASPCAACDVALA